MAIKSGEPGITLQQCAVCHGLRLRAGAAKTGGGHVYQPWIGSTQFVGAKAETLHDTGAKILYHDVAFSREPAGNIDGFLIFEIEHDGFFSLTQHRVKFGCTARVSAAGRLHLDHLCSHRG